MARGRRTRASGLSAAATQRQPGLRLSTAGGALANLSMPRPDLRARWEVLHPEVEWDTVADTVRDAWEHVAGAMDVGPAGAPPGREPR